MSKKARAGRSEHMSTELFEDVLEETRPGLSAAETSSKSALRLN